jgi:hypothetical protein
MAASNRKISFFVPQNKILPALADNSKIDKGKP